jgi:dipeptidyl-peptidase 4
MAVPPTGPSSTIDDAYPLQSARTRRFTLGAPRDIRVSSDGATVMFLRSRAGDDAVNCLWALDVATGETRVVVDPRVLLTESANEQETAAEKLRRERAREAGSGIVAYDADPMLRTAVFVIAGQLFRTDVGSGTTRDLGVRGAFDPRLDPTGERVAYVSGSTLRVVDAAGDRLVIGDDDDSHVSWGSAEFVAAEEMHRSRGFWWGPAGDRLLVARVDVSAVAQWWIASPAEPWSTPQPVRYPMAGSENASVTLAIVGLDGWRAGVNWAGDEFEYLCDASWSPRSVPTVVAQTRDQTVLAVLAVDPHTGQAREVYRQTDPAWVELVPGAPRWVGDRLVTVEDRDATRRLCCDGVPLSPPGVQVRRVIEVIDNAVFVAATTEPTEVHLARCDLTGEFAWITEQPGVHAGAVGGDVVVVSSTSLGYPGARTTVRRAGDEVATIANFAETPMVAPSVRLQVVGQRELRVALVLPRDLASGVKLPVLLDPYGGPHALRVQKSSNGFATSQWFADQGFAVIVCDGRGTPARGPAWERAVRGDFATPVLEDQVDALMELARLHPQLDLSRVAIRGWSFGGYLAALAVLRRPDVFHAAIAGAPVTEWGLYDTHYTERYLGDPRVEPQNDARSDLVPLAASLSRPLLLVHGMADDNVVVAHTLRLSRALLEAGRAHRVLPLSGTTHMTPQETVAANLLTMEVEFLREVFAQAP